MSVKTDDKFIIQVAASIAKTLHSRDSAERLVRTVISMWRARPDAGRKNSATLILDFEGIEQLSESAAGALIEFRREFSEDKNPSIEFSNLSPSVSKTLAAVEKPVRRVSGKVKTAKKKQSSFTIEI